MKIVILDGFTNNPGDLSWSSIEQFGDLEIYERSTVEEIRERGKGAEIILTNKAPLNKETLEMLPDLRLICVMATGYNIVDVEAASRLGITVCNVRDYSTPSVVQHTFSLILQLLNETGRYSDSVKAGGWHDSEDFSYWSKPIYELSGRTIGIVGFGNIGQAVARAALAFGMNVISHHKHPERDAMEGVKFLSLDELLELSDIVTLHCPLTEENIHMINQDSLRKMKKGALLINTARGGLVDFDALCESLESGEISGAGLDVLEKEPPDNSIKIPGLENLVITPHQAWASYEARKRLIDGLAENIEAFISGHPKNVVSS